MNGLDRRGWWDGLDTTLNRLKYLQFSSWVWKVDVENFIHFDKWFLAKTDIHSNSWLIPQISHYPLHVERLLVMNFSSFSDISQGPQFWSNIVLNRLGFVASDIKVNISQPQYHTLYLLRTPGPKPVKKLKKIATLQVATHLASWSTHHGTKSPYWWPIPPSGTQ